MPFTSSVAALTLLAPDSKMSEEWIFERSSKFTFEDWTVGKVSSTKSSSPNLFRSGAM
jgi:hypothetical protein